MLGSPNTALAVIDLVIGRRGSTGWRHRPTPADVGEGRMRGDIASRTPRQRSAANPSTVATIATQEVTWGPERQLGTRPRSWSRCRFPGSSLYLNV
jgi:hypothetical protein